MIERFISALPALGAVIGAVIYYPYIWLATDYHENIPYLEESFATENIKFTEYIKPREVVKDKHGKEFSVPDCKIGEDYSVVQPVERNGRPSISKSVKSASGWGKPIIRIVGEKPIVITSFELQCLPLLSPVLAPNPKHGGPMGIPGTIESVESRLELVKLETKVLGSIQVREVIFEKPFTISDFVQYFSIFGAWISLIYLVRHVLTSNSTGR